MAPIITANDNFLDALGYRLDEIQGKHHSMFVLPAMRESAEYRAFWANLNRGEFQAAEYKRIAKGGREVWIQASYNPILDRDGKPCKVIKFATDITAQKIRSMEDAGRIAAIGRAQAVIEFNLDGTIVTANDIFLGVVGYSLAEIQGKHHSMFVGPGRARQQRLSRILGEPQSRRVPVGRVQAVRQGRQGSLDPRLLQSDPRRDRQTLQGGEVRHRRQRAEAENRRSRGPDRRDRQVAGGDRVRHGRHGARPPTKTSSNALGYSLGEIQGKHHSMFVPIPPNATVPTTANSGRASTAANIQSARVPAASARAAARSGSRPPTIRSATSTASRTRS